MDILLNKTSKIYTDYPVHKHAYWEILINFSGSGTALIGKQEYPFQPGTIFCIRPGTPHKKASAEGFSDGMLILRDFPTDTDAVCLQYEDDANQTFRKLFDLAFEIQVMDNPNAAAIVRSLAEAMQQLLFSWKTIRHRSTPVELFQKKLLDNVSNCDFVMADAIAETGYSASYFRRMFKEVVGHSPVDFLHFLRVQYAKTQLIQYSGIRSIRDIAFSAGFTDPYYFSRVFKQHTGVSPQQYITDSKTAALEQLEEMGPAAI